MMKNLGFGVSLGGIILSGCSSPPANEPDPMPVVHPALETTAQLTIAADHAVKQIAVVSNGYDAAIAYGESEGWTDSGFTQTRIKLQRLDFDGKLRGMPTELGVLPFPEATTITIASDTAVYFVCWNGGDEAISCAKTPVEGGDGTLQYSTTGRSPALAFGPAGLVLARVKTDAVLTIPLLADGTVNGDEITFPYPGAHEAPIFLLEKEMGYTLVVETDGNVIVQKLNTSVKKDGPALNLGVPFWFHAVFAQSKTNLAVGLAIPYGMNYYLLDDSSIVGSRVYDDTVSGKTGVNAALVEDGESFGMLSPAFEGGLKYGLVTAEGTTPPGEVALDVPGQSFQSGSFGTFRLEGEPYFAAAPGGAQKGGSIVVAHVVR